MKNTRLDTRCHGDDLRLVCERGAICIERKGAGCLLYFLVAWHLNDKGEAGGVSWSDDLMKRLLSLSLALSLPLWLAGNLGRCHLTVIIPRGKCNLGPPPLCVVDPTSDPASQLPEGMSWISSCASCEQQPQQKMLIEGDSLQNCYVMLGDQEVEWDEEEDAWNAFN